MSSALINNPLWKNEIHPIWPATTFTLHRNLSRHLFPNKLPEQQKQQLASLLTDLFLKDQELSHIDYGAASATDREFIHEHFLCGHTFGRQEPGTGAIVNTGATFLGQINIDDHLLFHLVDHKGDWNSAWSALLDMENRIANTVEFAYSPRFGHLTAKPGLCGTGLKVTAFLHLPAIIELGQLDNALKEEVDEQVVSRNIGGDEGEYLGDLLALTNRFSIGTTEEQILRQVYGSANRLMNAEKTLRPHLKEEKNTDLIDKMSRALGMLTHSVQIETAEALNALSLIKLGIHLGWISGISDETVNSLMFGARRAHLLMEYGDTITQEELLKKRAEKIQSALKEAQISLF